MGVSRAEFEATWSKQMAANTVTSMVNGLHPVGVLNRNRFRGERGLACAAGGESDRARAVARAQATLARVFTFVGATERYVASLWLLQRVFGWGEAVLFQSLVHPKVGFRTLSAAKRGVVPFKATDDFGTLRALISSREVCDVALYDYAASLLATRLGALGPKGTWELREFERRVQITKARRR